MKNLVSLGLLIFVLSFCNLSERIAKLRDGSSGSQDAPANAPMNAPKAPATDEKVEKPEMTETQNEIVSSGQEVKWDEQGIAFTLPKDWKKMNVAKTSFNYGSPDRAFLIGTISVMPDNFPSETSLAAQYESALQQLKNGKYENVRYLELDGIKGVEFVETMPEEKTDPRRHQWIGFRNYLGQNQQLNIMLSTGGNNFDKHRDDFSAVLYSANLSN